MSLFGLILCNKCANLDFSWTMLRHFATQRLLIFRRRSAAESVTIPNFVTMNLRRLRRTRMCLLGNVSQRGVRGKRERMQSFKVSGVRSGGLIRGERTSGGAEERSEVRGTLLPRQEGSSSSNSTKFSPSLNTAEGSLRGEGGRGKARGDKAGRSDSLLTCSFGASRR